MSEIMLAFGSGDIIQIRQIHLEEVGVKVLLNEEYRMSDPSKSGRYPAVCSLLRKKGANPIMLDTKLGADTPEEMNEALRAILNTLAKNGEVKEFPVTHLTAGFSLPSAALNEFARSCHEKRIEPVIVLPTSRYDQEDFGIMGTTPEIVVSRTAKFCADIGASMMTGAIDAHFVNGLTKVYGVGAVIDLDDGSDLHARPSIIHDTKEYVDVFLVGKPIFHSANPAAMLQQYQAAACI